MIRESWGGDLGNDLRTLSPLAATRRPCDHDFRSLTDLHPWRCERLCAISDVASAVFVILQAGSLPQHGLAWLAPVGVPSCCRQLHEHIYSCKHQMLLPSGTLCIVLRGQQVRAWHAQATRHAGDRKHDRAAARYPGETAMFLLKNSIAPGCLVC